jgi:hypothetical protein
MPLSESQKYLDHLGACSPCYRDFLEFQAKYRQRRARMIFAAAASVLIVVGLATWAMLRQQDHHIARVVVDLRGRSMPRGTEPPPNEPPVEVPRNASRLDIYLPLGSAEGSYEVRVASARNEPLVSASGDAKLRKGLTILSISFPSSLSQAGSYRLQLRRDSASGWASFPLRVR